MVEQQQFQNRYLFFILVHATLREFLIRSIVSIHLRSSGFRVKKVVFYFPTVLSIESKISREIGFLIGFCSFRHLSCWGPSSSMVQDTCLGRMRSWVQIPAASPKHYIKSSFVQAYWLFSSECMEGHFVYPFPSLVTILFG
jgi:hypothetical protein